MLPKPESESLACMERTIQNVAGILGILLSIVVSTSAQNAQAVDPQEPQPQAVAHSIEAVTRSGADPTAAEVEKLKRRVEEIETQNRLLLQAVEDLKSRLEGTRGLEEHVQRAAEARPVSAAPAQAKSQTAAPDASPPLHWSDLLKEGNRIKLYGFLRLDLDFDGQRPNNAQTPLFVTSPDPTTGRANGDFSMHPRLTRLGIDFSGPTIEALGNSKLSGKLETDFENGGTESRQIIRIRHAFLRLDRNDFSILAGQTWDIVSPLFPTVNSDTLQWNAGNVGDRRPQLRAAYEPRVGPGRLSLAGGIGLTGAIDAVDLDNNGFRDGEESRLPDVQARIGYSHPVAHDSSASIGLSGFYGYLKTSRPVGGRTNYHSQLANLDYSLPLSSFFVLRGEGWWGRNTSDIRGGAGQGINVATGREIRGRGGWSEANLKVSRFLSLNPGFSTDDPVDSDVPAAGRTRNRAFYLANRITPSANFLIGADYLRWRTDYKGLRRGIDDRFNFFLQYSF